MFDHTNYLEIICKSGRANISEGSRMYRKIQSLIQKYMSTSTYIFQEVSVAAVHKVIIQPNGITKKVVIATNKLFFSSSEIR